jgi:hypothetical protein
MQVAVQGEDVTTAAETLIHDVNGRGVEELFVKRAPGRGKQDFLHGSTPLSGLDLAPYGQTDLIN